MAEKEIDIVEFDEILDGAAEDDFGSPDNPLDLLSDDLPAELQTKEAKKILQKIDQGIEDAERGVRTYFHNSPKRAVEFQQNHIAYLELKAKILKLISDNKSSQGQSFNQQNNTIVVDPDTAKELTKKLTARLYGNTNPDD